MNEKDQLRVLADRFGVPGIDLSEVVILIDDLDLIPREVCETHGILPVLVRGEHLFLAMANPADHRVIDEIEFVTGKKVYPYAALTRELTTTTAAAHDALARRLAYYIGPNVSEGRLRELGLGGAGATGPGGARRPANTGGASRAPGVVRAPVAAPIVTPLIPPPLTRVASQTTPRWTRGCTSCRPSPPPPPRPIFAGRAGGRPGQRRR